MKQDLKTIAYNITLEHTGYYRPESLGDNPPVFLTRHIGQHPYQIVDYMLSAPSARGSREAYLSFRLLTQLELTESVGIFVQADKDKENYVQVENSVYTISMRTRKTPPVTKKLNTLIDCEYDHSGPRVQVLT